MQELTLPIANKRKCVEKKIHVAPPSPGIDDLKNESEKPKIGLGRQLNYNKKN